jgi:hypothetical protein
MFGLEILLLAILAAILFKWLFELAFKAFRRRRGAFPVLEDRIGAILFLVCADVLAVIDWWYPWWVATHHAAEDDRYGGFIFLAFPFWFIGAGISTWALFVLFRALAPRERSVCNTTYVISGVLLALLCFSPLVMLAHLITRKIQGG